MTSGGKEATRLATHAKKITLQEGTLKGLKELKVLIFSHVYKTPPPPAAVAAAPPTATTTTTTTSAFGVKGVGRKRCRFLKMV